MHYAILIATIVMSVAAIAFNTYQYFWCKRVLKEVEARLDDR
jgi:hypothetical protein